MALQGVEAALEDIVRHALGKGVGLLGGRIEFGGTRQRRCDRRR